MLAKAVGKLSLFFFFFFNDTATTEIYTLSLHDALPIFCATGQRWGNPLYDWEKIERTGFRWWLQRFAHAFARFDAVRLDHFIGFTRYWEVPAHEPTAEHGRWRPGPGAKLFQALGPAQLIAEDLGEVTPEVTALRERFHLPGMKVLQFAFGTDPQ